MHRIAEMYKYDSFAAPNTRGCKYSVVSPCAISILRREQYSTLRVQNTHGHYEGAVRRSLNSQLRAWGGLKVCTAYCVPDTEYGGL